MHNKLSRPKYELGVGSGLVALIAYRWAATVVQEWGWKPSERFGWVFGMMVGFSVVLLLVDYGLGRLRIERAVRGGLWAGAVFGPYAGLVAWEELAHPVWAQVIGLGSTLLVFVLFYFLERRLRRPDA